MTNPKNAADPKETVDEAAANGEAAAAVENDLDALQARIADAEQKRDEYLDLLQRTRADFENYQKRSLRDIAQERKYAHGGLAADLLPALDNLTRATAAAKQASDQSPLAQGVSLVQSQLLDILRRHGITPIGAVGQPFDPNQHQAVMQQPSADLPPGSVVQVLEQGFMIHDRVLRPAKVIVSTMP
jgi:molecular chaperone GrpE